MWVFLVDLIFMHSLSVHRTVFDHVYLHIFCFVHLLLTGVNLLLALGLDANDRSVEWLTALHTHTHTHTHTHKHTHTHTHKTCTDGQSAMLQETPEALLVM